MSNDKSSLNRVKQHMESGISIPRRCGLVYYTELASIQQLAQLGMVIEIINHEFSGTIRSVRTTRSGLRRLLQRH